MGPMGPRGLGPIKKKRKEGPGGRKDRAEGRTGRTDHAKLYLKISKFESISVRIQKKTEKMRCVSLCKMNYKFAETAGHGSSLGRNRFGTKIGKLNKQSCFSTIGFGCWSLTAYKND